MGTSGSNGGEGPGRSDFHGRRRGRRLRPGRRRLLATLLPALRVPLGGPAAAEPGRLDPRRLFTRPVAEVWLEVGFGGGEHLAAQAAAHPAIGLIGCEPYVNGVASLLARVQAEGLDNVRIHPDTARPLLDALADACIARAFVLFPDPWPKTRQHKRRFVSADNLRALARVMTDGAELRLASDDMGYVRWMLEQVLADGRFDWLAEGPEDWRRRPADWPASRYEAKALAAGRRCVYLRFRRRPRPAQRP